MENKIQIETIRLRKITIETLTLEQIYIFFLSAWSMLSILTDGTMLSDLPGAYTIVSRLEYMLWLASGFFILLKICLQADLRDWKLIILGILGLFSIYFSKGIWVAQIIIFVCGAKNIDIRKCIRSVFICQTIAFFTIVFLSAIGLIENVTLLRSGGYIRYSLGFYHPNTLASRIFQLAVMYYYLKDRTISWIDTLIIGGVTLFVYRVTNSLTAVFMLLLLCVLSFITYFINKKTRQGILTNIARFCINKLKYIEILAMFLGTYAIINLKFFAAFFSGNMLSRINQSILYFQTYGLSLFGTQLENNSDVNQWYLTSDLYTLDNGYMYLLIGYGIIFFILFIVGETLLLWMTARQKDYVLLTVLSLYAIYGFSETNMIRFSYNFSLLFLARVLWPNTACRFKIRLKLRRPI